MAQTNNYIIVHADEKRYLTVSDDGRIAWIHNLSKATRFSQSRAINEICRHGLSAAERKYSEVAKEKAPKKTPQQSPLPNVVLRYQEGGKIRYLRSFSQWTKTPTFTDIVFNARKFKTFEEAQEFLKDNRRFDVRLGVATAVHENVAHVAENALAQRPAQDKRIQQVVDQFNGASKVPEATVRVWTFQNERSVTGLSMVVSIETSKLSELDAWEQVRTIYKLNAAFPISCRIYEGEEARKALELAKNFAQLRI